MRVLGLIVISIIIEKFRVLLHEFSNLKFQYNARAKLTKEEVMFQYK